MIAVTGANGHLGQLVIEGLVERVPANQIIAAVRSPEKASSFATLGVQVRWRRAGNMFAWNGLDAQVLSPDADYMNYGTAANDDSLVMRLSYGKSSVLLEGDAEAKSEATMLAHGLALPSTPPWDRLVRSISA